VRLRFLDFPGIHRPAPAFACLAFHLVAAPSAHAASAAPWLAVGEPAGFADLAGPQEMLVDVYFEGARAGETRVEVAAGTVRLASAPQVVAMLPPLRDRDAVVAALARGNLPAHRSLACSRARAPGPCGSLAPEVAGVIFDRDRFRLDIFVNPRLLEAGRAAAATFIPVPDRDLSLVGTLGVLISGQTGSARAYNLEGGLVAGSGARRLRARLGYSSGRRLEADTLALEWDRPGIRYMAGALWVPGSEIAGRRKLAGLGVESQIDTRADRENLLGTPLALYLGRRARVEILREGRLIHSAIYEAGPTRIATEGFADGAYEITVRIAEEGGAVREERRFFTKSRRIPSLGRTDFFAFGGLALGEGVSAQRGLGDPHFQAGVSRRLSQDWALDAAGLATGEGAALEMGATWLTPFVQVRAAATGGSNGALGGLVQIASTGSPRLAFNLDMRAVNERLGGGLGPGGMPPRDPAGGAGPPREERGGYLQLSGTFAYGFAGLRLLGSAFLRDERHGPLRYTIGPAIEWDALRRGPLTLTVRGDTTLNERGRAGFAGLALRLLTGRGSRSLAAGARHSAIPGDDTGDGAEVALGAAWSPSLRRGELTLGAGLERRPDHSTALLSGDLRQPFGSLAADFARSTTGGAASNQYTLGLQTSLIAGGGTVRLAGRAATQSMILARVEGAGAESRFELLVDEQVVGTLSGGASLPVALAPYRAYNVRLRPAGADLVAYDAGVRRIGLYPGSVTALRWEVAPIAIRLGRLAAPDGTAIAGATILGKSVWARTDARGFFQIEAADGAELTVTTAEGRSFALVLPRSVPHTGVARLGEVTCCGATEQRLGSLSNSMKLDRGIQ
jgi:Mat/Ecp fimbriae outer membrane usher protein